MVYVLRLCYCLYFLGVSDFILFAFSHDFFVHEETYLQITLKSQDIYAFRELCLQDFFRHLHRKPLDFYIYKKLKSNKENRSYRKKKMPTSLNNCHVFLC